MLELKNIRKIYKTGDTSLAALNGVSLCFRENEFVSILGPSGCGKTTMLNIIGGLDRYTDGDLSINGRSTKFFKDKDWDTYRNHSIGFVFQSYNLIPHQTVLANVELALTLSGVSKSERRAKATEALKKVGLGDHIHKKPNQMSGGQMQRVAIARALVNNPDILLADEPTGALDTQTSVQIMDLLKEIAEDRLVIMVTHNPELAEEYSTRIVSLSDGQVVNDTNPISEEEYKALADNDQAALTELKKCKEELKASRKKKSMSFCKISPSMSFRVVSLSKEEYADLQSKDRKSIIKAQKDKKALIREKKNKAFNKKKSMSFGTAISLSFKNLLTKKGRTILTSFAGSIGIIGIALILSLSNGINLFIQQVQEDTLSTYPLTIQKVTQDSSAMMDLMTESKTDETVERDPNLIYVDDKLGKVIEAMLSTTTNDLVSFKKFLEDDKTVFADGMTNKEYIDSLVSDIQYTYDLDLQVYNKVTLAPKEGAEQTEETTEYRKLGVEEIFNNMSQFQSLASMVDTAGMFNVMSEMIDNQELLDQQYELVGDNSRWPTAYNEVVLVVGKDNSLSMMTLYMLGLLDAKELQSMNVTAGNYNPPKPDKMSYTLEELMNMELTLINKPDVYEKTDRTYSTENGKSYSIWQEREDYAAGKIESLLAEKGITLKITGIVRPRVDATASSISSPIGYTKALTDMLLEANTESEIIKQQYETPNHSVLTGVEFTRTKYTPENIHELLAKISDSKKEMFFSTMKQTILSNPEYMKMFEINDTTFAGMFLLMPTDVQTQILSAILSSDGVKNAPDAALAPLFAILSNPEFSGKNIIVTKDNLIDVLPAFKDSQTVLPVALGGIPASEQMPMAIPGLAYYAGEEVMNAIYAQMTDAIPSITVDDNIFTMIVGNLDANSDEFKVLEEMLYKQATNVDATFDSVILELGAADESSPASINFYAKDFESKGKIEDFIAKYNEPATKEMATEEEKAKKIEYTDIVGSLMSSVTIIIDVISYVLIAFVSISLVVSSIMIGIITNISVLERTKEIGILRAIGASKKDISRVFNAETFIVGLIAGLLGILITILLCIPANAIIAALTGFNNIRAVLPPVAAIVLIIISMGLTMLAGLIPSKKASKKDPVVALRTE